MSNKSWQRYARVSLCRFACSCYGLKEGWNQFRSVTVLHILKIPVRHCLQNHLTECSQHSAQTVTYPEKGKNILKFDKVQHMFPVPFALYADFESFITPYREHVHTGFCCLRVSKFPQYDHVFWRQCRTGIFKICNTVTDRN